MFKSGKKLAYKDCLLKDPDQIKIGSADPGKMRPKPRRLILDVGRPRSNLRPAELPGDDQTYTAGSSTGAAGTIQRDKTMNLILN